MNEESQSQSSDCIRRARNKDNYENTSDGQMNSDNAESGESNVTTRKTKKRMDVLTVSV